MSRTPTGRTSFAAMNCSVAQALAQVGDAWTLMILRDAFNGITRFDEFEAELGIATSTLADRLRRLTQAGILDRRALATDRRVVEYQLTRKGRDLHPLLVMLAQWGERWQPDLRGARVRFRERKTGKPVAPVRVRSGSGRALAPHEVVPRPGPGADAKLKALFEARAGRRGQPARQR